MTFGSNDKWANRVSNKLAWHNSFNIEFTTWESLCIYMYNCKAKWYLFYYNITIIYVTMNQCMPWCIFSNICQLDQACPHMTGNLPSHCDGKLNSITHASAMPSTSFCKFYIVSSHWTFCHCYNKTNYTCTVKYPHIIYFTYSRNHHCYNIYLQCCISEVRPRYRW